MSDGAAGPQPAGPTTPPDHNALVGFSHDVDVTGFDTRFRRWIPVGMALLVAAVAPRVGVGGAVAIALGFGFGLAIVILATERTRWRAQDVLHWYLYERLRRWRVDTGGSAPRSAAEAEVWLGTHQPGTVPPFYRAVAAIHAGDEAVYRREVGRLPDAMPADRAMKTWAIESRRLNDTGTADTATLRRQLVDVTHPDDRATIESWLAIAEANARRAAGDRTWLAGLAAWRASARRTAMPARHRIRVWASRFAPVIAFGVLALIFSATSFGISERGEVVPAEYARTRLATRGSIPSDDRDLIVRVLPRLERALPAAVRARPGALGEDAANRLIEEGLPTLIWETGEIDLARPADAATHRVWSIEVLLGGIGPSAATAIVTFDRDGGPAYLYRIDPEVVRAMRSALGLPVPATSG